MKKAVIVSLLCVNATLLAALIFVSTEEPAYGQMLRTDYIVLTAKAALDWEALYIIDMGARRMVVLGVDKARERVRAFSIPRDLARDFGRPADNTR